jgi:Bacterial regulatory proteins, luxR family
VRQLTYAAHAAVGAQLTDQLQAFSPMPVSNRASRIPHQRDWTVVQGRYRAPGLALGARGHDRNPEPGSSAGQGRSAADRGRRPERTRCVGRVAVTSSSVRASGASAVAVARPPTRGAHLWRPCSKRPPRIAGSPLSAPANYWQHLGGLRTGRPPNKSIEALSERELDVLRLLGTDLDGPEMARQLMVSVSSVRTHTKSIYSNSV